MHQLVTTLPKYELLANKTLEELGLGAKQPVYSIRRDQHVKDAFEIIAQKVDYLLRFDEVLTRLLFRKLELFQFWAATEN